MSMLLRRAAEAGELVLDGGEARGEARHVLGHLARRQLGRALHLG